MADSALAAGVISVGVTLSPPDDPEPDGVMRHADQALYRAWEQGRKGYVFHDAGEGRRR